MKILKKLGFTNKDLKLSLSFLLVVFINPFVIWLFSIISSKIKIDFINWEGLYAALFLINLLVLKSLKNEIKGTYSTFFKVSIPKFLSDINYLLLLTFYIPRHCFHSEIWTYILIEIYVLLLLITMIVYFISYTLPFTYSKEYKEVSIGNFFDSFSDNDCNLRKISSTILNNEELKVLIRPLYLGSDKNISGCEIIENLANLKKNYPEAFFRLKAAIKLKTKSHFWDIFSIITAVVPIFVTLTYNHFFNDIVQVLTSTKSAIDLKYIGECIIIAVPIILIGLFFKYGRQEANERFYYEIQEYIEESEKSYSK